MKLWKSCLDSKTLTCLQKNKTMKKKILIISIAVNIIAGAFVLMGFESLKEKETGNIDGPYIYVSVVLDDNIHVKNEIIINDRNKKLDEIALKRGDDINNNIILTNKLSEFKNENYEIVSTSSFSISGGQGSNTNYVLEKK